MKNEIKNYEMHVVDREAIKVLEKYPDLKLPIDQGVRVSGIDEQAARETARDFYPVMKGEDASEPDSDLSEIRDRTTYWDLWTNVKYTSIKELE